MSNKFMVKQIVKIEHLVFRWLFVRAQFSDGRQRQIQIRIGIIHPADPKTSLQLMSGALFICLQTLDTPLA